MVDRVCGMSMTTASRRARVRPTTRLTALVVALGFVAGLLPSAPSSAEVLLVARDRTASGPLGPITVIGDSVLLGSVYQPWAPTLDDQLLTSGWGPVKVRAGVGMSAGAFDIPAASKASYWIQRWRSEGWDPVDVVVNIGANDSATCAGDTSCAYTAITHLVDVIGPGHRVWWPKITRHPVLEHEAFAWNLALDRVAAERENVFTWDWPTVMYAEGQYESDHTHLTVAGYRRRSVLMAHEITADLGRARRTGGDASVPAAAGAPSELVPVGPVRVLDTRDDPPGRIRGGTAIEVDLSDAVPDGATAAAVYLTATTAAADGFLTAYECSTSRPTASAVNYRAGQNRGAVTITPLSADGRFCVFSRADTDVVVDLQAAFVPAGSGGGRFTPLAEPVRLADTRDSGRRRILEVAVPDGADAAAVNVTAVDGARPGYLVAYPCTDDVPLIATVNHGAGEVVSGTALVPVGPGGTICVFAKSDVDVVVDLTGVFSDDGDLVFVPVAPTRTIDTRSGVGGWSPIHGQGQTIDARVAPADAAAVSGTLTLVRPMRRGHLRAWACGELPETANVTAAAGEVLANSLTTGVDDDGRLCVFARSATATVFDTTGWWVPAP